MFAPFFLPAGKRAYIIYAIGSEDVTATLMQPHARSGQPIVYAVHREHMPFRTADAHNGDIRQLRKKFFAAALAMQRAAQQARVGVDAIMVTISAPHARVLTQHIRYAQTTPVEISEAFIEKCVSHAYEKERAAGTSAEATLFSDDTFRQIEEATVDIRLNGYSVDAPIGKHATDIEIAHVRGYVSHEVYDLVAAVHSRTVPGTHVYLHSSTLVQYAVLRDRYPRTDNFLLVDITGSATEVSVIREGVLYEAVVIPYGMYTHIHEIARHARMLPEEAYTAMRGLEQTTRPAARKAVAAAQSKHVAMLKRAGDALSVRHALPKSVYVLQQIETQQYFTDIIKTAFAGSHGHADKRIESISAGQLSERIDTRPGVQLDARTVISVLFFHKMKEFGGMD